MQARTEGSVLSSLSELRSIERQRIDDERSAREREIAARIEAERATEQARRDAEDARLRAERDEQLAIVAARAAAEREARMHVEAVEAAERARLAAELEQQRHADEMALRRAEVAKKRPRWMIAVTALAIVATATLAVFAIDRAREADAASAATQQANQERQAAVAQARESRAKIEQAQHALDELQVRLDKAIQDVTRAQGAVALREAQDRLAAIAKQKADAQRILDEQKREQDKRDRDHIVDFRKCSNSGSLGCMDHK